MNEAAAFCAIELRRGRIVGQVERQQRLELAARGERGENSSPIVRRRGGGRNRRREVRHDDCSAEYLCRCANDRLHLRAVPQMNVEIVGAKQRQRVRSHRKALIYLEYTCLRCPRRRMPRGEERVRLWGNRGL